MHKACVVGSRKVIGAFTSLGFGVYGADTRDEALAELKKAVREGFGLVLITEELAAEIPDEIETLSKRTIPVVGIIPGPTGSLGTGFAALKSKVEKALGADILFRGEESSR